VIISAHRTPIKRTPNQERNSAETVKEIISTRASEWSLSQEIISSRFALTENPGNAFYLKYLAVE
jgi:hypothetical protein